MNFLIYLRLKPSIEAGALNCSTLSLLTLLTPSQFKFQHNTVRNFWHFYATALWHERAENVRTRPNEQHFGTYIVSEKFIISNATLNHSWKARPKLPWNFLNQNTLHGSFLLLGVAFAFADRHNKLWHVWKFAKGFVVKFLLSINNAFESIGKWS